MGSDGVFRFPYRPLDRDTDVHRDRLGHERFPRLVNPRQIVEGWGIGGRHGERKK